MKLHDLVSRNVLKDRRNYKRKSKYETGYSADNMVYKNFIKDIYENDDGLMGVVYQFKDLTDAMNAASYLKKQKKVAVEVRHQKDNIVTAEVLRHGADMSELHNDIQNQLKPILLAIDGEDNYNSYFEDVQEDEDMNPVGPSYDMPKYLYHATFTKNVPNIKQKGLLQFQPSLWIKGPGGSRYNEEAGIFAFDDPEDALNWAGKMAWEFRDTDKDISIIRIDMEDEIWDDDPAEDPFVANKGRALRSGADIKADRIVDAIRVDDLGKPGDLGISRDEWLAQVTPKLREDTMPGRKFYHGSHDQFEVGEILTPGEDEYEEGMENVEWYHVLHQHRPMESRQHSWSVFMTGNEDDIDVAGGSTDYVYEVEPIGDVERHDINWASEISYLLDAGHEPDSDEIKEAAANYWAGKPHHNEQVWEYLAPKAKIVGVLAEGDMKADREAGIKYVDDPDWERLHDMDDKIIQAYIDHKEPKEELNEGVNDPHIFKAVFMAGCPGAGKSYVSKALFGGSGLRVVNTDQALEYLMAKHGLDPTMPDSEREERDIQRGHAKELTSKRRDNYVDGRLGLIIDGTGKDDGKIQNAKKELEDLGYETKMVFVDTDLETAHERNMKRPERSVKPELLDDTFKMCRAVGGKLRRVFNFKEDFHVINNSKNSETEDELKETYDSMQRWLATPVTNREALDWMDEQTGFSEGLATVTEDACGDCFSKAGRALMDTEQQLIDNTTLVHALVRGQGKLEGRRFPHAWTEMGDVVFDNANGNNIVMRKEQYYKLGGVEETKGAFARYEHHKGLANMLKQGHWGPWDLDDSLNEEEKQDHGSSIANAITEKFASDAQRRGFFKHKGKKKA